MCSTSKDFIPPALTAEPDPVHCRFAWFGSFLLCHYHHFCVHMCVCPSWYIDIWQVCSEQVWHSKGWKWKLDYICTHLWLIHRPLGRVCTFVILCLGRHYCLSSPQHVLTKLLSNDFISLHCVWLSKCRNRAQEQKPQALPFCYLATCIWLLHPACILLYMCLQDTLHPLQLGGVFPAVDITSEVSHTLAK